MLVYMPRILIYIIIPIVTGISYINCTILGKKYYQIKLELFKSSYYVVLAIMMICNATTNKFELVVGGYTLIVTICEGLFGIGSYIEKSRELDNNRKKEYFRKYFRNRG